VSKPTVIWWNRLAMKPVHPGMNGGMKRNR